MPGPVHFSPKKLENMVKKQLEKDYMKRFNISALPNDVKKAVADAARTATSRATKRNMEVEALKTAKSFYQPASVTDLISGKLGQAKLGVKTVAQSADLKDILQENAKMLRQKWQALVDAGFTQDEAFLLIKAEVEGKASRRGSV